MNTNIISRERLRPKKYADSISGVDLGSSAVYLLLKKTQTEALER